MKLASLAKVGVAAAAWWWAPPPDPGSGEVPPGEVGAKITLILQWVAWFATAAFVGAILYTAVRMAIAHRRGDETNIAQLGWVLFACVLGGSASAIVAALI